MITWGIMLVLAAGVYGQRLLGMVAVEPSSASTRWREVFDKVLEAVPLAIIAAVIALQSATGGGSLEVDARLVGVAAAGVCVWRRLPLAVVVVVAASVTALVRAL